MTEGEKKGRLEVVEGAPPGREAEGDQPCCVASSGGLARPELAAAACSCSREILWKRAARVRSLGMRAVRVGERSTCMGSWARRREGKTSVRRVFISPNADVGMVGSSVSALAQQMSLEAPATPVATSAAL